MRIVDGKPGEEAKTVLDQQAWAKAQDHHHFGIYLSDDAHEATWTIPRKHRHGLLLWGGRANSWATNANLKEWNLTDTPDCACEEAPDGETIEHILRHCPLYNIIRRRSNCHYYQDPGTDLKYLMGYVDADGTGKFGQEPTKTRTKNAKEAIETTLAIWFERGNLKTQQQTNQRQNGEYR